MDEDLETGETTRRAILGDEHVDRSTQARTQFDAPFQEFITKAAWNSVWSRDTLPKRERSMVTLAILAATGCHEEFALHLRACRNTGASRDDILEVLLHVAVYGGVPKANSAVRIAKEVFAQEDREP